MSATSTPNDSPASIRPLHNPSQAAHVAVPQAPLGNVGNQAPGMGAKALLAKKLANHNPTYVSPTDNLVTPCTQKLSEAKKKHFTKPAKPVQLFAPRSDANDDMGKDDMPASEGFCKTSDTSDDENPFQ